MFGYRSKLLTASTLSPSHGAAEHWRLAEPPSGTRSLARDYPLTRISATLVCLLGLPTMALAGPSFLTPGLPPGSPYRLIFVTSTTTAATDNSFSYYNNFVNSAALFNSNLPATTWTAIVSTNVPSPTGPAATGPTGGDAISNVDASCTGSCLGAPIYLVDGATLIANNQSQLFSGSILNPISEDENATSTSGYVWTGSNSDGTTASGEGLGTVNPMAGTSSSTTGYLSAFSGLSATSKLPIYAISGQLTVPVSSPEPMSGSLLLVGGAASGLVRRLRRRRQSAG